MIGENFIDSLLIENNINENMEIIKTIIDLAIQYKEKHYQFNIVRKGGNSKFKYRFSHGQEQGIYKESIILQLDIPVGVNLFKEIKENIALYQERKYIDKCSGSSVREDDLINGAEYEVSTTNSFNIVGMDEEQFLHKIKEIFKSRFNV